MSERNCNRASTMAFVVETANQYDPDPSHGKHVTMLALALFDELRSLHGCGSHERHLLEIAGRLHDIGWSRTVSGKHHKLSSEMILELHIPDLDKPDLLICSLIARYHTKALPDSSRHQRFASMNQGRREAVEWLAGILRVADGLDCNHARIVRQLSCTINKKKIAIRLESAGDCRMEIEKARRKQNLLEKKTGRTISYLC